MNSYVKHQLMISHLFHRPKEKITQTLHLDLSTGDKITPEEIDLNYKTFLLGDTTLGVRLVVMEVKK